MPDEMPGGLLAQNKAITISAAHLSQYWTQVHIVNYRPESINLHQKRQ